MIRANEAIRREVEELQERMVAGMQMRNAEIFMKVFGSASGSSSIGIEQDSIHIGTISLQRDMEELFKGVESINIKFGWNTIQATEDGQIVWMAANSTMTMKKTGYKLQNVPLRMTFIMERNPEGHLLISHLHFSTASTIIYEVDDAPVSNDSTNEHAGQEASAPVAASNNDDGIFYDIP